MAYADYELGGDGEVRPTRGWGGARPGAGQKPAGYKKPDEVVEFEKERAAHERIKRQRAEFAHEVERGKYVAREAVKQASATLVATLVQGLRSLSDKLERDGVDTKVCIKVDQAVTEALEEVGRGLQMLSGEE